MKNKELINKELDEQIGHRVYCDITGVCGCGLDKVKLHISSIRQNDVDELIKWIETKRIWEKWSKKPSSPIEANVLECIDSALSDIITHLKSIKEKI